MLEIVFIVVLGVMLICIGFVFMLMKRNEWVCKNRIRILYIDMDVYDKLPSYEYMLYHFWIWNVEKFIK
jgi:hypothetical protein